MKFASTIAASMVIGAVVATADAEHVERALIAGGDLVKPKTKTYMAGIRLAHDDSICGGVLVAPRYVLATVSCTSFQPPPKFVAVGTIHLSGPAAM